MIEVQQNTVVPELTCLYNKQALFVCQNNQCQKNAIMCCDKKCQCKKGHQRCSSIQIDPIIQGLITSKKQIPDQEKKSFDIIQQILNSIQDQISTVRDQLCLARKHYGLNIQSRQFYEYIMNQQTQKITGKLISLIPLELQQSLKTLKIRKSSQIIQNWKINQSCFKDLIIKLRAYFQYCQPFDTVVNSKITQDFSQIYQWIRPNFNLVSRLQLLYRASGIQFNASDFHKNCDNLNNTVVLIKTQFGKIIGGFTPLKWNEVKESYAKDPSQKTFIFSLTEKQKIKIRQGGNSAIFCGGTWGPNFGGCALGIQIGGIGSCLSLQSYYFHPSYQSNQGGFERFSGQKAGGKFKIQLLEVFQVV